MTAGELRGLAVVHGGLAWTAVAALAGALAAAWKRPRLVPRAVPAAVALGVAAFATGALLHAPFQGQLRQRLFLASSALGWLFERKEHAAFGALMLLGCGLFGLWAARIAGREGDAQAAATLRRAYLLALATALAFEGFALVVSLLAARRVWF